jgi:hypothetical protein
MGIMSEIDIMRQEGAREAEDFEAFGYDPETAEAMAEVVQRAETPTREARLEAAVLLILAIEEHPKVNIETVKLAPKSRAQLREALA